MKKTLTAFFLASVLTPAVAFAAEPTETDPTEDKAETIEAVDVKLEVAKGDQQVGELAGLVAWDQAAELSMDVDGHRHVTKVVVRKAGKNLKVQLGYQLDGKSILESVEVSTKASRKKIVKSSDGAIAIALTLAPKTVAAEELAPKKNDHHIDLPTDNTDPLGGL